MDDCKPQAAALVIFELCFSGAVIWLCGHPGPRSVLLAALLAVLQLLALGWTFRNIHLRLRAMAGMLSLHEEQERAAAEHSARLLTAQTRLFALQNQINPHFLYNTFDTIRSIALEQNQEDIAQMTKALANLFRYSISRPGEMATLAEEIDNSKSYLLIQQYRFPGKFTVEWQVDETDEAVMNCVLPVLTLQPLFENALHHGIEPMMSSGNITVRIWTTQDR